MPVIHLTATNLRSLPAIDGKMTDYRDDPAGAGAARGLILRVSPSGARVWYVAYKRHGRKRHFKLGELEGLTLAKAREHARNVRSRVQLGGDPQSERLAERRRARHTVADLCVTYLEREGPKLSPRTAGEWKRVVEVEIAAKPIGRVPAAELLRGQIIEWSERLQERSGHVAAHAFAVLRRVYSWAVGADRLAGSPFVGLKPPAHPPAEARVLTARELRAVVLGLRDVAKAEPECVYPDTVELLLRTLSRASMVTGLVRDELEDLDTTDPRWVVPPRPGLKRRVSGGGLQLSHVVPLVPAALAVVRRRLSIIGPKGRELFPTQPDPGGRARKHRTTTITDGFMGKLRAAVDLRYAADELGLDLDVADPRAAQEARDKATIAIARAEVERRPHWKLHHLRHTASTQMRERLGVSEEVVGLLLAHTRRRAAAATRIYDRSELLDQRRAALIAWSAWLDELSGDAAAASTTAKVLPMSRG